MQAFRGPRCHLHRRRFSKTLKGFLLGFPPHSFALMVFIPHLLKLYHASNLLVERIMKRTGLSVRKWVTNKSCKKKEDGK